MSVGTFQEEFESPRAPRGSPGRGRRCVEVKQDPDDEEEMNGEEEEEEPYPKLTRRFCYDAMLCTLTLCVNIANTCKEYRSNSVCEVSCWLIARLMVLFCSGKKRGLASPDELSTPSKRGGRRSGWCMTWRFGLHNIGVWSVTNSCV